MAKFQPQRDEQIFTKMLARVIARTDMSDVADTSTVKHMLAAAARADGELYYQLTLLLQLFSIDKATGDDLDERAKDVQPSIIKRRQATKAVGTVIFSRNGTSGTITIPVGTKVKTPDGVVFSTTSPGTIGELSGEQITGHGVGRDSGPVPVLADIAGSAGRVSGETVTKFVSKPAGVDEVTNPSAFQTAGLDKESDDDFRNRIKTFIAGLARSTVVALEAGVIGAQDPTSGKTILFSKAVEDLGRLGFVTLYVDDGTGTAESTIDVDNENLTFGFAGPPANTAVGGETTLKTHNFPVKGSAVFKLISNHRGELIRGTDYLLNTASGQIQMTPALVAGENVIAKYTYYTGLIALGQKIIDGDKDDRTNFPGLRAAGILVVVQVPQVLLQNIEVTLVVSDGYVQETVAAAVAQAVKDYINNLAISGDVVKNELIARIMAVAGVQDCDVIQPEDTVTILDDQLARTTDENIDVA